MLLRYGHIRRLPLLRRHANALVIRGGFLSTYTWSQLQPCRGADRAGDQGAASGGCAASRAQHRLLSREVRRRVAGDPSQDGRGGDAGRGDAEVTAARDAEPGVGSWRGDGD